MTRPRSIDAGEMRELVTKRYGAVLTFGGSFDAWRRGMRLVRVIARITGIPQATILRTICADYRQMVG